MKPWGSALFPLSILAALAVLTFWLRYATDLPSEHSDGKFRHDPDYVIGDAQLRKLDENGVLQYTLNAKEIHHYPDDDSTDLRQPHLVYQKAQKPTVTMSADQGRLSQDNERVDLTGNVRVLRAATPKDAELVLTTTELTVLPDDEKAFTDKPVLITQGPSWIKGVGLHIDQRAQTYVLQSQATASIASKSAKKPQP
ncbi:LPS export ABC transporter periplasmic protein LptC [Propionivibrio limicola]|uniref:LPS export ABC transporter periplasmic protein LptC n=1 Tax=Propionivibrio limicola TaxID=167645 RepID=UPI001292933F|nr:LPS export ABC transporter periplasmic protein LptC [Propionivibrio limicola]